MHAIERRSKTALVRSERFAWFFLALFSLGNEEQGGIFTRRILRVLRNHLGADDSQIELYYDAMISDLKTSEDILESSAICVWSLCA